MNTLGSLNLDQPMAGQGMITWLLGYLALRQLTVNYSHLSPPSCLLSSFYEDILIRRPAPV